MECLQADERGLVHATLDTLSALAESAQPLLADHLSTLVPRCLKLAQSHLAMVSPRRVARLVAGVNSMCVQKSARMIEGGKKRALFFGYISKNLHWKPSEPIALSIFFDFAPTAIFCWYLMIPI